MLKQANRERINQDTDLNTSEDISNTERNGQTNEEYTNQNGEDAYSSSGLSSPSPTRSDQVQNDPLQNVQVNDQPNNQYYDPNKNDHRNNPLFRSDAFEQIPSQMHQVMSQNTNFGNREDRGGTNLNDITNNTDQNLQENFRNEPQGKSNYDPR